MQGMDDDVVVVVMMDASSSVLKRNEPVELTPLELCTLRKELVMIEESFLSGACSLFQDIRLVIAVDEDDERIGCIDADEDEGLSAVKYRPKFLRSDREFRRACSTILNTSDSTLDERRAPSSSTIRLESLVGLSSSLRTERSRDS